MILLVGNLKGGTGKSTLSFNLAVWATYQFRRVLLIDADPLHTISNLLEVRKEERHQPVLFSIIADESRLKEEVKRVSGLFDDIIVDIAAGDIEGFRAALQAADKVLVPILPGQADVWALDDVMDLIGQVREERPEIQVMAVINKADTNVQVRETQETAEALAQVSGLEVAPVRIGYRILLRRSLTEGLGVIEWAPKSLEAKEINALAEAVFRQS